MMTEIETETERRARVQQACAERNAGTPPARAWSEWVRRELLVLQSTEGRERVFMQQHFMQHARYGTSVYHG